MAKRLKGEEGIEDKVECFYPFSLFAVFPFTPVFLWPLWLGFDNNPKGKGVRRIRTQGKVLPD